MNPFLNLTPIHRHFTPKPRRTALEEWRAIERREQRKDWLWAVLGAVIIGFTVGSMVQVCFP